MSPRDCPSDESLVDALCDRFEIAWQSGERPDLSTWLPAESRLRQTALVELARIDLELRLRKGEPARVEHYLDSFPELRSDSAALLRLVSFEARLRLGREAGLTAEDFRRRFPDLAALPGWESVVSPTDRVGQSANGLTDATTDSRPSEWTAPEPLDSAERLRLVEEIGRGGMGLVIRGRDNSLGRDVAVKVLLEPYANEPQLRRRLLEEARITGQLQHPGIVPVHDVGWFPDGRPYYTMKLIRGRTLIELRRGGAGSGKRHPQGPR
jgi:hypothetical protein